MNNFSYIFENMWRKIVSRLSFQFDVWAPLGACFLKVTARAWKLEENTTVMQKLHAECFGVTCFKSASFSAITVWTDNWHFVFAKSFSQYKLQPFRLAYLCLNRKPIICWLIHVQNIPVCSSSNIFCSKFERIDLLGHVSKWFPAKINPRLMI